MKTNSVLTFLFLYHIHVCIQALKDTRKGGRITYFLSKILIAEHLCVYKEILPNARGKLSEYKNFADRDNIIRSSGKRQNIYLLYIH